MACVTASRVAERSGPDRARRGPRRLDQRIPQSGLAGAKRQVSAYARVLARHRPVLRASLHDDHRPRLRCEGGIDMTTNVTGTRSAVLDEMHAGDIRAARAFA